MNPQEQLNQNIRVLIGDLQVSLMMANARIQELEGQLAQLQPADKKSNGAWRDDEEARPQ